MRFIKQLIYGFFYLSIFFGALWIAFRLIFPPAAPEPYPAEIRTLAPLIPIRTVFFVNPVEKTIDLGAEIRNPNLSWGVRKFDYVFVLKDASGAEVSRVSGSSFILPGERRWIIRPGGGGDFPLVPLPSGHTVASVDFVILPIPASEWQKLRPFAEKVSIAAKNLRYERATPPRVGFADFRGEVENRSDFLLDEVEINGVIFGEGNRVLAIGRTLVRTLRPGESRAFTISWRNPFSGAPVRWEAWGHANFLNDATFVKQFGE
jgi:hypothetical protein